MNMFNVMEDALLEASRMQREICQELGMSFAEMYPEEAAELRLFLGPHEPITETEEQNP